MVLIAALRGNGRERHDHIAALCAVTQRMVYHHQRQQCFCNGRGANAHARVVAAFGLHLYRVASAVDAVTRREDGAGGLDGDAHLQVLPRADTPQHATGVVVRKTLGRQAVAVGLTKLRDAGKTSAHLDAFDRVQAHHGVGDVGVEPVVNRLP